MEKEKALVCAGCRVQGALLPLMAPLESAAQRARDAVR